MKTTLHIGRLFLLITLVACAREKARIQASYRKPLFRDYKLVAFMHDVRGVREIQEFRNPRHPEDAPVLRDTLRGWGNKSFSITISPEPSTTVRTDSLLTRKDGIARLYIYSYYPILYHLSIDHGGNEVHTISFSSTDLMKACWQTMEELALESLPVNDIQGFTEEGIPFKEIALLPELSNGIHPMLFRRSPNHSDVLLAGISEKGVMWCLATYAYEPEKQIQVTLNHTGIVLNHYFISMEGKITDLSKVPGFLFGGSMALHDGIIAWYDKDNEFAIMPGEQKRTLTHYRVLNVQGALLDSFAVNGKFVRYQGSEYIWYDTARKSVHLLSQGFDSLYVYQPGNQPGLRGYAQSSFRHGAAIKGKNETEIWFYLNQKFRSFVNNQTGEVRIVF